MCKSAPARETWSSSSYRQETVASCRQAAHRPSPARLYECRTVCRSGPGLRTVATLQVCRRRREHGIPSSERNATLHLWQLDRPQWRLPYPNCFQSLSQAMARQIKGYDKRHNTNHDQQPHPTTPYCRVTLKHDPQPGIDMFFLQKIPFFSETRFSRTQTI